ncbi:hypothetical protein [Kitasatospora sp. NPDC088351]|uniref:hypothetical protein n=1 Tax=unclassified Kitasatospora TaxID=2633591 RepID=UPI0034494809
MSTRKRDAAAYRPRAGELVLDGRTGRTGIYMDTIGGEHYLRPLGGGREWTTRPDRVGPAPEAVPEPRTAQEPQTAQTGADPDPAAESRARLSARLAARNRDSRLNEGRVA